MKGYDEAAAYLGVQPRMVRRLVSEKRIGYTKVGKFVRFTDEQLNAYIEANAVEPEPASPLLHLTKPRTRRSA